MATFRVLFAIAAILSLPTTVGSTCYSRTLYARTYSQQMSVSSPSNYEYCSFYIRPSSYYSSSYFLEISWSSTFDVKGNMPYCNEDSVEVFLTSSYRNIGKFCSGNAGAPFKMYSKDGYAKIIFRTDGYTNGGQFTFYYKLRSKTSSNLGYSSSSTSCYNTYSSGASGTISSSGWPRGYQRSSSSCLYKRYPGYYVKGTRVVFMDIDLKTEYYSDDSVQLYGSNNSANYKGYSVSSKLTGSSSWIKSYTTYNRYLLIEFQRTVSGYYSSKRGFVAGYIAFTKPVAITDHDSERISSSVAVGSIVGAVLPIVIIVFFVILCSVYAKQRQRRNAAAGRAIPFNQTQNTAVISTTQHSVFQPTAQPVPDNFHAASAFSKPGSVPGYYPPSTGPVGSSYPTNAYPTYAYPTNANPITSTSYPAPYAMANTAPPQYAMAVTNEGGSAPVGQVPPPYRQTDLAQPITTDASYPSATTANHGGYPPAGLPPVDTMPDAPPPGALPTSAPPPNAPPPSYDSAILR